MVFPAYCFSNPPRNVPMDNEIMEEVMWILEDGVVEQMEIHDLIELAKGKAIISPSQEGETDCQRVRIGLKIFLPALIKIKIIAAMRLNVKNNRATDDVDSNLFRRFFRVVIL